MNPITICINTSKWELKYIQLLLKSIEQNMFYKDNEILIFIDTDAEDNQIENSLKSYSKVFKNFSLYKNTLPTRIGYQHNVNLMFRLAKNDVVLFIQSDMVAGPDFDKLMLAKLEKFNVVCGTRIEPPLHGDSPHTITRHFGLTPDEFQMGVFNDFCKSISNPKVTSHFFAPFMMNRVVWLGIGGHDTRFRRSREDSDILIRLVLDGIKIVQPWDALFYHFTCTSSRGQGWFDPNNKEAQLKAARQQMADRVELCKFIRKWGTFLHDTEKKLVHYKLDCFVDVSSNKDLKLILPIGSFFEKIYLNDGRFVEILKDQFEMETNKWANELDGYTESEWREKRHLYNSENWNERLIYVSDKSSIKSEALVIIDPSKISKDNDINPMFLQDVSNLHNTLHTGLSNGRYDAEFFELIVNNPVEDSTDKIIVKNPEYNDFKKIDTTN